MHKYTREHYLMAKFNFFMQHFFFFCQKTYLTSLSEMRSHPAKVFRCLGKRLWKPTEPVQTTCQCITSLAVLYKT